MLVSYSWKYIFLINGAIIISEYKRKDNKNKEMASFNHDNIKSSHFPNIIDHSKRFKNFIEPPRRRENKWVLHNSFRCLKTRRSSYSIDVRLKIQTIFISKDVRLKLTTTKKKKNPKKQKQNTRNPALSLWGKKNQLHKCKSRLVQENVKKISNF